MEEQKMTIFYLKDTGNIFGIWINDVGFEVFGEDITAYGSIMDKLVVTPEEMPLNVNSVKVENGVLIQK